MTMGPSVPTWAAQTELRGEGGGSGDGGGGGGISVQGTRTMACAPC